MLIILLFRGDKYFVNFRQLLINFTNLHYLLFEYEDTFFASANEYPWKHFILI